MRGLLMISFLSSCLLGQSQYYFNDILNLNSSKLQYDLYRKNKIHTVIANSYELDNSLTEGFQLKEAISLDGKKIIQTNTLPSGISNTSTRTYLGGVLQKTESVSKGIETKQQFYYDANGKLQQLLLNSTDTALNNGLQEKHLWQYQQQGQPSQLLVIKNNVDTLQVNFVIDEMGLVVEEQWKKNNRQIENWYYYYDAKKNLSDIVRYQEKLKKLIPDFQFKWNENGSLAEMIQYSLSSKNYLQWKYQYQENGLKISEMGFDKSGTQLGLIKYQYQ